jgi:glucose/arabinose dehydrogenase
MKHEWRLGIAWFGIFACSCVGNSSGGVSTSPGAVANANGGSVSVVAGGASTRAGAPAQGGVAVTASGGAGSMGSSVSASAGAGAPAAGSLAPAVPTNPNEPIGGPVMSIPAQCSAPTPNPTVGNTCKGTPPPAVKLTMVTNMLIAPTFLAQAPGDPSRLYVLEQSGAIRVIKDGMLNSEPFMTIDVTTGGLGSYTEAGLLGLAFDPNFEQSKRFWVNYSGQGYTTMIMEYMMTDPDKVEGASGKQLLTVPQLSFNHKGGMLAFGHDGCLYVGMGDGGNENDTQRTGQGTSDMLSVMLRVDVDKFPMPAPGNLEGHIWSTGLRNPWRFSFDRERGDLYIGDVGQNMLEEIDVEPRGVAGRNYGWSEMEGSMCMGTCDGMTPPAFEYRITPNANSVIGGYVYRGAAMPDMVGRYVWADWSERKIRTLIYKGESAGEAEICDSFDTNVVVGEKVRAFGQDLAGELYVMASGMGTGLSGGSPTARGTLYKIEPQ